MGPIVFSNSAASNAGCRSSIAFLTHGFHCSGGKSDQTPVRQVTRP